MMIGEQEGYKFDKSKADFYDVETSLCFRKGLSIHAMTAGLFETCFFKFLSIYSVILSSHPQQSAQSQALSNCFRPRHFLEKMRERGARTRSRYICAL